MRKPRFGRHSVFFRMFGVFFVMSALILVGLGMFFRASFQLNAPAKSFVQKNAEQYATYLAGELGNPPSEEKGRDISRRLGLQIRVEAPNVHWSTDASLPEIPTLESARHIWSLSPRMGHHQRTFFLILERNGAKYAFGFSRHPAWVFGLETLATVLAGIMLILVAAYFAIRLIFRPLRFLMEGVRQIGEGNLDYRVDVCRHDELGELGSLFNQMSGRVREMVRAREQLLLDVSHELRSPLARLRLGVELLPPSDRKAEMEADIRELDRMIGEILETHRLGSIHGGLRLEQVSVGDLISEVASRFEGVPPGITLQLGGDPIAIRADRQRLSTALRNLIENACKYSVAQAKPVLVELQKSGNSVRVIIRDHGPGIAPEERERIFEPFYRVDKARVRPGGEGGYGLGLSLARRIAEAHGGRLWVENEPGWGASFILELDAVSAE